MKSHPWFTHSNPLLSRLRVAAAGSLLIAGIAVAFVAAKTSSPPTAANYHAKMWPLAAIGPRATLSDGPTVLGAPGYHIFTCQRGVASIPGETCYDPYQMRHAYGTDSLIAAGSDGTGHTIVIVDAFDSPFLNNDLASFDATYGLPTPNFTQFYPDGNGGFDFGWASEMTLDVESSHAIAPGANIVLVHALSNSDADILSAIKYAVDNNLGDVISMSFGESESCVDPDLLAGYHAAFVAATQKGITLFASSGDQGAALPTCDGNSWSKAASSPASDPLVTAVGGTELHATGYPASCTDTTLPGCSSVSPVPGTYESEIVWNEGPTGTFPNVFGATEATGGGFSVLYDQPTWQRPAHLNGVGRGVPDVAYSAAILHGILIQFLVGQGGGTFLFGGTSCGSPQWAALTVIANQKAGGRLGFLNSAIYKLGKHIDHPNPAHPASFNDIVSGNNNSLEFDSMGNPVNVLGFSAGDGWDPTTGIGSPIAPGLVQYLVKNVKASDAEPAIAMTAKQHGKPIKPGHMKPH